MKFLWVLVQGLLVLWVLSCGDKSTGPNGGNSHSFSAAVDGQNFTADANGITALITNTGAGGLILIGTRTQGNITSTITITLNNISKQGTYPLGVGPFMFGGTAYYGETEAGTPAGENWGTPLTGIAGEITLSAFSENLVSGTFFFEAEPSAGSASTGTRSITNGQFNVPLTGTRSPSNPNAGSKISARLNGNPFVASLVSSTGLDLMGGAGFSFSSASELNSLSLNISGLTGIGTFNFSGSAPMVFMVVGQNGGTEENCCWGLNAGGDELTIEVTAFSSERVTGTFSGTLQPQPGMPATNSLIVTEGEFDIGL